MFTGIIEEMGVVKEVIKTRQGSSVSILAKTVLEGLRVGDSVTVNGVCLTVVGFDCTEMKADISPETAKVTTLGSLKAGDPVNLERAMRLGDRLGGHLVTGHVDAIGTIRARVLEADALQLMIETPREVLRYCVPKGSITVDGIRDRKSTRLNSSHSQISYAVFCLKKKKRKAETQIDHMMRQTA